MCDAVLIPNDLERLCDFQSFIIQCYFDFDKPVTVFSSPYTGVTGNRDRRGDSTPTSDTTSRVGLYFWFISHLRKVTENWGDSGKSDLLLSNSNLFTKCANITGFGYFLETIFSLFLT